jgi:prepilin-type processing-associated H-X9-DG protein
MYPYTVMPWSSPPADAADPFAGDFFNDAAAGLFLLARAEVLTAMDVFICPSTDHVVDDLGGNPATGRSNFSDLLEGYGHTPTVSYTYANAYPMKPLADAGYALRVGSPVLTSEFAVCADRTLYRCASAYIDGIDNLNDPGPKGNSRNHKKAGQNVLYGDGHVSWVDTNRAGHGGENIYACDYGDSCNYNSPMSMTDSLMQ